MIIYHMTPALSWQAHAKTQSYQADTLATEGFIHCTREEDRLVQVANHFYRQITDDFVVLSIETDLLASGVRWEAADGQLFPHIYGPIQPDAIVAVTAFPRNPSGHFLPFIK